jgi:mono/diheme cytochrome c family protein
VTRSSAYSTGCVALTGLLAAVLAFGRASDARSAETRSVRDGVFSAEQVDRGRETFLWVCNECHEIEEFTGVGAYFEEMDGEPLWDALEYIWTEMPEDMPSWLDPGEYADVLAYLLSVYGLPAGEEDMPVDEDVLEAVIIEGPLQPGR